MKSIKIYLLLFLFFILAMMPSGVFGGDYSTLNFIGFSADGKYLAFEEYGTQDGSGFPYSNYYFIDVAKNSYAAAPVVKVFNDEKLDESKIPGEEVMRSQAKKAAAANLKKFKIVAGNTGKLVVARLLTDLDAEKISPGDEVKNQSIKFTDFITSLNYHENDYELSLKTYAVKVKACEYNIDASILKFELSLKELRKNTEKILQKDATLPESRGCPHTYSIQNVYLYADKIAVFMNVYMMGFEGPDMRYMVVTGNFR